LEIQHLVEQNRKPRNLACKVRAAVTKLHEPLHDEWIFVQKCEIGAAAQDLLDDLQNAVKHHSRPNA
jgi:hypothetical protein